MSNDEETAASLPRIFKYTINVAEGPQRLNLIRSFASPAQIVNLRCRPEAPTLIDLWFFIPKDAFGTEERHFSVYGTGEVIPRPGSYVGTAFDDHNGLVFHVFEDR